MATGNVDHARIVAECEAAFSQFQTQDLPGFDKGIYHGGVRSELGPELEQVHFLLGF